jgi:hypothetical protein
MDFLKKTVILKYGILSLLILILNAMGVWAQSVEITKIPRDPYSEPIDFIRFYEKIKSVKQTIYVAEEKFGEIAKGEEWYTVIYELDANKNLIEWSNSGSAEGARMEYDAFGRIVKETGWYGEPTTWAYSNNCDFTEKKQGSGLEQTTIKRKYDNNCKCIEESEYNYEGKTISREIRDYDEKGHYTSHSKYINGKLEWKCSHELDDRGNQISQTRVIYNGSQEDTLWIRTDKYNEFNKSIEFEEYRDNQLCRKSFSKYSKDKIKIERKGFDYNYDSNGVTFCRNYFSFFNSNGDDMLSYGYYFDSNEDSYYYWHYKYDEKGNLIEWLKKYDNECRTPLMGGKYSEEEAKKIEKECKNLNDFDFKTEYVYTYDKHGNWVTQTVYEQEKNSLPICTDIIEREIEYYEE